MGDRTKLEIIRIKKDNRPKLKPVLFDAQDEIDRRQQLIAEIEEKLQHRVSQEKQFSIRRKLA